jgi:hypothetical protein
MADAKSTWNMELLSTASHLAGFEVTIEGASSRGFRQMILPSGKKSRKAD